MVGKQTKNISENDYRNKNNNNNNNINKIIIVEDYIKSSIK